MAQMSYSIVKKVDPAAESIQHLRQKLVALDTRILHLAKERLLVQTKLANAVALQAPVRNLPDELLAAVFNTGVAAQEDDPLFLDRITLVCKHWRSVALATPALWARIVVGTHDSLDKARRAVVRSRAAPLDVTISFSSRSPPFDPNALHAALDLLAPQLHRWRSFTLRVPARAHAVSVLARCKSRAPLLEELHLHVHHALQDCEAAAPLAFAARAPRLRMLAVTSVHLGPETMTGLRVLRLTGLWAPHAPSTSQLLGALRASPALEELALRNLSDDEEEEDFTGDLVPLPALRKLNLSYSGSTRARTLLRAIAAPALRDVELAYLDDITPAVGALKRMGVHMLRRLRVESSLVDELALVRLLRRAPGLTTLELVDVEDVSGNLLRALSTPPDGCAWILPELEVLAVPGCAGVEPDALRALVEARPRLRSLDVARCAMVGRGTVQWLRMYVGEVKAEE